MSHFSENILSAELTDEFLRELRVWVFRTFHAAAFSAFLGVAVGNVIQLRALNQMATIEACRCVASMQGAGGRPPSVGNVEGKPRDLTELAVRQSDDAVTVFVCAVGPEEAGITLPVLYLLLDPLRQPLVPEFVISDLARTTDIIGHPARVNESVDHGNY